MRLSFLVFMDRWKNKPFTACEIGVYEGFNSLRMLNYTPLLKKLYMVDNFAIKSSNFSRADGKPFSSEEREDLQQSKSKN